MSNLRFIKLELENFKSFRGKHQIQLERRPGLYFIKGRNLAEPEISPNGAGKSSIWDALFWCLTGRTIRAARPGAGIEPWSSKGRCIVSLSFVRNEIPYRVERSRRPNGLWLGSHGGELKTVTQPDVDRTIWLSAEALRRTIIIGQFGDLFLDLKAEAQSQMFTEVLDLDLWLQAADQASKRASEADHQANNYRADANSHRVLIREVTESREIEVGRRDRFAGQTAEALAAARSDLSDVKRKLADARKSAGNGQGRRIGATELADLEAKEKRLNASLRTLAGNLGQAEGRASALRGQLAGLTRRVEDYRAAAKTSLCPECGQKVTKAHLTEKLNEAIADQEATTETRDKEDEAIGDLKDEEKELRADVRQITDDLVALRAEIKGQADAKHKQELVVTQLEQDQRRHEETIARLQKDANPYKQRVIDLDKRLADLNTELADNERLTVEYEAAHERNKYWIGAFKQIRMQQIDEALEEFEVAANRHALAQGLVDWEIRFATERETQAGTVSVGFSITIMPPGQSQGIPWESYSGGESQRWQLATTFGLSEVLLSRAGLSPNIEVLDEPTKHISPGGVDDLLQHLADRAEELGRAIYFVDHHSYDSGAFREVLVVEKDRDGSCMIEGTKREAL